MMTTVVNAMMPCLSYPADFVFFRVFLVLSSQYCFVSMLDRREVVVLDGSSKLQVRKSNSWHE